jgi:hypothetical protein
VTLAVAVALIAGGGLLATSGTWRKGGLRKAR